MAPFITAVYSPGAEQLAAEATAAAQPDQAELPTTEFADASEGSAEPEVALARYEPPMTAPPQSFEAAFATDAPHGATPGALLADAVRFISQPVVQTMPARYGIATEAKANPNPGTAAGSHLVQLGSFHSEQGARRAWGLYTKRHPALGSHTLKVTQAKIAGRAYWRVSAAGFDKSAARAMCDSVRNASKDGCISYSAARPLPGAVS